MFNVGDRVKIIGAPCGMLMSERYKDGVVMTVNGTETYFIASDNQGWEVRSLWFPASSLIPAPRPKVIPLPLPG